MTNTPKNEFDFQTAMKELEAINTWFQEEEIDLEEGLKKLKQGRDLIKKCQARLAEVENEFLEIKESFEEDPVQ